MLAMETFPLKKQQTNKKTNQENTPKLLFEEKNTALRAHILVWFKAHIIKLIQFVSDFG